MVNPPHSSEQSSQKVGFLQKLLRVRPPDKKRSGSLEENQIGSKEFIAKQQSKGGAQFIPREDHPLWKKQEGLNESKDESPSS